MQDSEAVLKNDATLVGVDGAILFKLHDTLGFPLEISCNKVYERGYVIAWAGFVVEAEKAGWTFSKTIEAIENHIVMNSIDLERAIILCSAVLFNSLRAKRPKK